MLISLCVVLTPLAQWWLLGQRPQPAKWVFSGVSVVGAALLSGGLSAGLNWGDALILMAAALRAITVCKTSQLTRHSSASALALTAVQAGVMAAGSLVLALLTPGGLTPLPTAPAFWQATVYLVLGCTVFAFFCTELGPEAQRPQPGGLAHQQRAGLWRPVCGALAGGAVEPVRLAGWRADCVGRPLDHAEASDLKCFRAGSCVY